MDGHREHQLEFRILGETQKLFKEFLLHLLSRTCHLPLQPAAAPAASAGCLPAITNGSLSVLGVNEMFERLSLQVKIIGIIAATVMVVLGVSTLIATFLTRDPVESELYRKALGPGAPDGSPDCRS